MKKETQEVTLSLAAAKDISIDAVVVMNLSQLDCIFTKKKKKRAKNIIEVFPQQNRCFYSRLSLLATGRWCKANVHLHTNQKLQAIATGFKWQ